MDEQKPEDKDTQSQEVNPLAPEEKYTPIPHSPEFQQQLEHFKQAVANSENQNQSAASRHKKNKLVPILLIFLIAALVAGGAYWYVNKNKPVKPVAAKTEQSTIAKPNYLTGTDKYVCGNAALTAVLCENVETHTVSKYEIPHYVGVPGSVVPSPDGSKVLIISSDVAVGNTNTQHVYIVDTEGKLVRQLPDFPNGQNYGANWLNDSKTIIYDWRQTAGQTSKSQLYTYDVTSGKSKQLTSYKSGLYYPSVTKSGKVIAYGNGGDNKSPEELASVSLTDGSVKDIDTTAAYAGLSDSTTRYFYNRSSDLFYADGSSKDGMTELTVVAKLNDSNGQLKLVPVASYKKLGIETSPVVTSKGIVSTPASATNNDMFQLNDGKTDTKLSLESATLLNGLLYATDAPLFAKADVTNQLVKSDFLYEYGTAPTKLHNFLVSLETQGCKSGQYSAVTLLANDSDQQAAVTQSSCGKVAVIAGVTDYYVYQDGSYKKVVSTKDVVSCKDAAKYGLSTAILPKCAH